ncbi:MAG TPA: phosphatidate cytidylyltransferase [Ktedonobacteraceae bacterium]|nr:phosphatidate cytidylyltransferase [Ktedonobacteraceae bacterium]
MRSATKRNLEPEAPEPAQPKRQKSGVVQRVITSFIAIPIVLVFVWFGGWWAFAAAGLVVVLGINELHTMMVHEGYHPLIVVSLVLSMLFMIAAMFPHLSLLFLEIGLVLALLVSFPLLFFRKKLDGAMVDWSLTIAIAVYLGWPLSLFPVLRGYQVGFSPGLWWVLVVLLGTWSFDSGAFFTGRLIGRHKLAPKISPAKTWEGAIGGLVCSIAFSLALTVIPLKVPWYLAIVLGILIGVAATLGDLAESLIKRTTHVKDSGHFMPGHGGILDRADSILFVVVVVFVFTQVITYL